MHRSIFFFIVKLIVRLAKMVVVVNLRHVEKCEISIAFGAKILLDIAIVKHYNPPLPRLVCAFDAPSICPGRKSRPVFGCSVDWIAANNICQIPGSMRVEYPDLDTTECGILKFKSKQASEITHASHTKAHNNAAAPTLILHHRRDNLLGRLLEIRIPRDGLNLVLNVVMFKQSRQNATGTECIGFEGDENQHRWGERVSCVLQMSVELRDQRPWKIHG